MDATEKPDDLLKGTPKQRKLVELLAENVRNGIVEPIGKTMLKAGYSEEVSLTPTKVTKSKTFLQLLDRDLPERQLTKKHKQLLNAVHLEKFIFPATETDEVIKQVIESVPGCKFIRAQRNASWCRAYFTTADNRTQSDALEMAYKLRKKLGGSDSGDGSGEISEEIREVVFRIRRILPAAGQ